MYRENDRQPVYIGDDLLHHGLQMTLFIYVAGPMHRHHDIFLLLESQFIPYLRLPEPCSVRHQRVDHHISHKPYALLTPFIR